MALTHSLTWILTAPSPDDHTNWRGEGTETSWLHPHAAPGLSRNRSSSVPQGAGILLFNDFFFPFFFFLNCMRNHSDKEQPTASQSTAVFVSRRTHWHISAGHNSLQKALTCCRLTGDGSLSFLSVILLWDGNDFPISERKWKPTNKIRLTPFYQEEGH